MSWDQLGCRDFIISSLLINDFFFSFHLPSSSVSLCSLILDVPMRKCSWDNARALVPHFL